MVRYTACISLIGTVATSSMQPYFSAVNKYLRDQQLLSVAVGDLLADARRGLEMRQQSLAPVDAKLALPAPVVMDMLLAADNLRNDLTRTPASLRLIELFRAVLTVRVNYTFFCRAQTGARCLTNDLTVNKPSQQIFLFVRKSKGDQRRDIRDKSY
jgi:hypothetical protein